jgi:hypothetical protein
MATSSFFVYTVRLPNQLLTGLFIDYVDAVDWMEIMDGESTVLIHVDHATYNALTAVG